jgi:guanine deaminase
MDHHHWLKQAVQLAIDNVTSGHGGPFAAIIVQNGAVIGKGVNEAAKTHDPTAHAEIQAIRQACRRLGTSTLDEAILYASGEPCPMCMAAVYWARMKAVYVACPKPEAVKTGYPDNLASYYQDMQKPPEERSIPVHTMMVEGYLDPFQLWKNRINAE